MNADDLAWSALEKRLDSISKQLTLMNNLLAAAVFTDEEKGYKDALKAARLWEDGEMK